MAPAAKQNLGGQDKRRTYCLTLENVYDMNRKIKEKIKYQEISQKGMDFAGGMTAKSLGAYASSTAFFFFLSLIPILILFAEILPLIGLGEEDLVALLTDITPSVADGFVEQTVREAYGISTGLLPVSFLVMLWSAAKGMLALISGLNQIYDIDEKRNYFYLRLIASVYTLLLLLVMVGMLVLLVFTRQLRFVLEGRFPFLHMLAFGEPHLRVVVTLAVSILLFSLVYTFVPGKKQKWIFQLPGAIFSAVAWGLFSYFFSLFVGVAGSFRTYYGSLATLIILLIWIYWCFYLFLIGGFINVYFHHDVIRISMKIKERKKNKHHE